MFLNKYLSIKTLLLKMDAYTKLDWSKQQRRCEQRLLEYFAIDFSRYEEDIFNLHINEIDPVHHLGDTFDDDQVAVQYPVDPRNGVQVRQLEIDATRSIQLYDRFPSGSWMNRADHQHCLMVLNRLNMRLGFDTPEEREALAKYKMLTGKLTKERALFDSFVKNYFNNNLVCRKRTIDQDLDDLVVAVWRSKVHKLLNSIESGKFHLSTAVMWLKYRKNDQNVTFEPVSEDSLELGLVKNIFTENLLHCSTLKRSKRVLDKFFNEQSQLGDVDYALHVDAILKQDEDVRFFVSSGTLSHLLNTISTQQQKWMVPFRIEMIGSRNVIIIDKKLQPTKMFTHQRNVKGFKYLVRSFMTIPKKDANQCLERKTCVPGPTSTRNEYNLVGFDEYLQLMEEKIQHKDKSQPNVCLQLWKLQDGSEQYKFLVKSRMDCYESLRKMKFYINVSIKLEYQAEFGAEQMTQDELIHEWTRQLLRPNSKTLRLRVNAATHVILSHHYLELRDIEDELKRTYDVDPRNLVTNLWETLKLLLCFPPGEHLMQHDTKNPETVMILSKDPKLLESSTSINVKELYESVEYERCALEEYEWIPIDRTVITKLHREHTLLPCTFPHWNHIQRIVSRERLKRKRPPPLPQDTKSKKKKSKGNRVRRKQKEREKKHKIQKQQAFVSEVQQSLDQYAPYEGPSRSGVIGATPGKLSKGVGSGMNVVKGETFDYQAYINQANAKKDE